jgi:hypothetical protein
LHLSRGGFHDFDAPRVGSSVHPNTDRSHRAPGRDPRGRGRKPNTTRNQLTTHPAANGGSHATTSAATRDQLLYTRRQMSENQPQIMSHAKLPPTLPTIVDEAADTPNWVPALGVGLFALMAMVFAISAAWNDAHEPPPSAAGAAGAQAVAAP